MSSVEHSDRRLAPTKLLLVTVRQVYVDLCITQLYTVEQCFTQTVCSFDSLPLESILRQCTACWINSFLHYLYVRRPCQTCAWALSLDSTMHYETDWSRIAVNCTKVSNCSTKQCLQIVSACVHNTSTSVFVPGPPLGSLWTPHWGASISPQMRMLVGHLTWSASWRHILLSLHSKDRRYLRYIEIHPCRSLLNFHSATTERHPFFIANLAYDINFKSTT